VRRSGLRGNPLLLGAVGIELAVLAAMLWIPPLAHVLGHRPPSLVGFAIAVVAVPAVLLADTAQKGIAARARAPRGR
jgi:hypothetical protein